MPWSPDIYGIVPVRPKEIKMSGTVQVIITYGPEFRTAVETIVVAFEQQYGRVGGRNTKVENGRLTDTITLYWTVDVVQAFISQIADKVGKENVR